MVGPVVLLGGFGVGAAIAALASSAPDASVALGAVVLLAAAVFAEAFPVPIEGVPVGAASLANIFIVGAAVVYGWPVSVVVAFVAMVTVETAFRRPPLNRTLYNSGLYVTGALAAGGAVALIGTETLLRLLLAALGGSAAFYAVNIVLLALVIGRSAREPFASLVGRYVRWTVIPFSIMASVTLMLVVLWERAPLLAAPLIGPLVAIALYQRSVHSALEAMRLARTDELTGLGNARHFRERLEAEFDAARSSGAPLTVCLLDVDDFKGVNDVHGHAVGDRVLAGLGERLREGGEAFRIGGDEFALLLPGCEEARGAEIGQAVIDRVAGVQDASGAVLNLSGGVASSESGVAKPGELIRLADGALYAAKDAGKNRVSSTATPTREIGELRRIADRSDRAARLRAAASLARAVDERDAYMSRHSFAVGELAAQVAARLGLDARTVELMRLAGRLHDVGKLAIPEEILRKRGPLTDDERRILERHAQIGFRMLESLGVEPVPEWVLHHHERWDGNGYPTGLAGSEIPLGARIIFAADAFDAMTSDRVYRRGIDRELALVELERCAGSQFDADVVAALREDVAQTVATSEPTPARAGP